MHPRVLLVGTEALHVNPSSLRKSEGCKVQHVELMVVPLPRSVPDVPRVGDTLEPPRVRRQPGTPNLPCPGLLPPLRDGLVALLPAGLQKATDVAVGLPSPRFDQEAEVIFQPLRVEGVNELDMLVTQQAKQAGPPPPTRCSRG